MPASELPSYCFLLGAGASQAVGIPTMPRMGKNFRDGFELPTFKVELEKLDFTAHSSWTSEWNIEALLNHLYRSVCGPEPRASDQEADLQARSHAVIAHEARKSILRAVSSHDPLRPLLELEQFFTQQHLVDVFSLNYDTVIEEICRAKHIPCIDGFTKTGQWSPSVFAQARSGVRLWKLHGSITWKPDEQGMPQKTFQPFSLRRLILSGHSATPTAETALIWPADKDEADGAFQTLQRSFADILPWYDVLIVAGYRFADRHILEKVQSALGANLGLQVIVICGTDSAKVCLILADENPSFASRIKPLDGYFQDVLASGSLQRELRTVHHPRRRQEMLLSVFQINGLGPSSALAPIAKSKETRIGRAALSDNCVRSGPMGAFRCHQGKILFCEERGAWNTLGWLDPSTGRVEALRRIRGSASDFAFLKDGGIAVLDSKLGGLLLGLGVLWNLNPESVRLKLLSPLAFTKIARHVMKSRFRRDDWIAALKSDESGFLSWPTSLTINTDTSNLVVSEARRLVEMTPDGRPLRYSIRRYFNLLCVRCLGEGRLLLLENVLGNEGVLWMVENWAAEPIPLVTGVKNASGLAFSVDQRSVYFCENPPADKGTLWSYDLRCKTLSAVQTDLNAPSRLDISATNELFMATADGLFRLEL